MTATTRERPILFSGPMVRATLDGRKTVTRRVIGWKPFDVWIDGEGWRKHDLDGCDQIGPISGSTRWGIGRDGKMRGDARGPAGEVGDHLWVRETWAIRGHDGSEDGTVSINRAIVAYQANGDEAWRWICDRDPEDDCEQFERPTDRWVPSIHMPRWASRLTLEVVSVRAERLHEITDDDALAEGVADREAFAALWDSINGERPGCAWSDDPWVWRIEFRRVEVPRG